MMRGVNDRLAPLLARTADALSERADGLAAHCALGDQLEDR